LGSKKPFRCEGRAIREEPRGNPLGKFLPKGGLKKGRQKRRSVCSEGIVDFGRKKAQLDYMRGY